MALACNLALSSMNLGGAKRSHCMCEHCIPRTEALTMAMLTPVVTCTMRGEEPLAQNSGSPQDGFHRPLCKSSQWTCSCTTSCVGEQEIIATTQFVP